MCDHATETKIKDTVNTLVSDRKMFTAFDVTRLINEGASSRTPNREVKKIVHGMFFSSQMADFDRDTVAIASANPNVPPWVYYPPELDPNDYNPLSNLPPSMTGKKVPVPAATTASSTSTPTTGDLGRLSRQGSGFIRIQAAQMRSINVEANSGVFVEIKDYEIKVRKAKFQNSNKVTDARNNLRIYCGSLDEAGLGKTITVSSDGTEITLT